MKILRLTVLLFLPAASCAPVDELRERLRGATPHEDYTEALRAAGLLDAALGRDWSAAADRSLRDPLPAALPVEESGYFDPARATAVSLRVPLRRGQRVIIAASLEPDSAAQLFIDVFRMPADSGGRHVHVAAADSGARTLQLEPSRSADYAIRVQPELLRGGRYSIRIHSEPTVAFPVQGVGERAIGSRFGAPRDGGARDHHGIDIFAPRGTPVLAGITGTVTRVNETPRGGRVVWLRDERRDQSLYFAHLDRQLVTSGQRVQPGDTVGTVGNTGNARTTPPHLHFGIYRRGEGPVDPYDFVRRSDVVPPRIAADTTLLGDWARARTDISLRSPAGDVAVAAGSAVHVRGASGATFRVELPDGTSGWVAAEAITRGAIVRTSTADTCRLRDAPVADAAEIATLDAGARLDVLGRFDRFALVRAGELSGWSECATTAA